MAMPAIAPDERPLLLPDEADGSRPMPVEFPLDELDVLRVEERVGLRIGTDAILWSEDVNSDPGVEGDEVIDVEGNEIDDDAGSKLVELDPPT